MILLMRTAPISTAVVIQSLQKVKDMKWLSAVPGLITLTLFVTGCDVTQHEPMERHAAIEGESQTAETIHHWNAESSAKLLIAFDEAAGQAPEGIAIDKTGNIFVSIAPLGQLWKIRPGSDTPEVFGTIDGLDPSAGDLGILGLATDARGNVYAGVQSSNAGANGVWVFDRRTGDASRIEGSENIVFANDLAFDKRGNLYITDSILGAIWRLPKSGILEPWLTGDENLAGTGVLGLGAPIGANGIEFRQGVLYVANTEKGLIVSVPIGNDGQPGSSNILAAFPEIEVQPGVFLPSAADGLALDVFGNIYVAQINLSTIVKVTPDGDVEVVFSGDPLDWPSSIKFGTSRGYQQTLFAVNFSIGEGFGDEVPRAGPGLVSIDLGVPGMPLP